MEVKETHPRISCGRPFGGVALLWDKRYQHAVFPIKTVSDMIIAARLNSSIGCILMIAVYMPVDYENSDGLDDYVAELGVLEGLLGNERYDHIIFWETLTLNYQDQREGFLVD